MLSALTGRPAGKPQRRKRTIRAIYDDDGVAIGTEDIPDEVPAGTDVVDVPPIEEEPAPGRFANVFGSIEGGVSLDGPTPGRL